MKQAFADVLTPENFAASDLEITMTNSGYKIPKKHYRIYCSICETNYLPSVLADDAGCVPDVFRTVSDVCRTMPNVFLLHVELSAKLELNLECRMQDGFCYAIFNPRRVPDVSRTCAGCVPDGVPDV